MTIGGKQGVEAAFDILAPRLLESYAFGNASAPMRRIFSVGATRNSAGVIKKSTIVNPILFINLSFFSCDWHLLAGVPCLQDAHCWDTFPDTRRLWIFRVARIVYLSAQTKVHHRQSLPYNLQMKLREN